MKYSLTYERTPTIVLHFTLIGDDLNPDVITQALGVSPSQAWAKGDPWLARAGSALQSHPPRPHGQWRLVPPECSPYDDFETQMERLLTLLESLPPALREFTQRFDGGIIIGYASGESNFGFSLDNAMIERLHKLGLGLDFDIYPYQEDDATDDE